VRVRGAAGAIRSVWSWSGAVAGVELEGDRVRISLADGTHHVHWRRNEGWQVDLLAPPARSSIDLGGLREERETEPTAVGLYGDATTAAAAVRADLVGLPRTFSLGEGHYRRSEESWREAGQPTAVVSLALERAELRIEAEVTKDKEPVFIPADAVNRYDNELPDINGDGLQVYVRIGDRSGAWVLVPEPAGGSVRMRSIPGWGDLSAPRASWNATERGYAMRLALPVGDAGRNGVPIEVDVIVNETIPGRERRRGQLVMSGADGEFAYLAGDRHDPARLLRFVAQ
jgi:hypothetical protein